MNMEWRSIRNQNFLALLTLILFILLINDSLFAASSSAVKMRIQTATQSVAIGFKALDRLAKDVQRMSNGRLNIQVLPDGAIVPAARIPDAINTGLVEAGATYAQYFAGKHIAGSLFGNPPAGGGKDIGFDQFAFMSWLMMGPGKELYNEYFRDILKMNVVVFPVGFHGPLSVGWFSKPIKSVKDMKERRYRTGPGLIAETWKKMGVPATFLPGGEILPAAQRGVIDGAQWGGPYDDVPFGFHQVWKNYYIQGAHFPISNWQLLINKDFWTKLSPDLQAMIEVATEASVLYTMLYLIHQNGILLKEAKEKQGVKVYDVPKEIFEEFSKEASEVVNKYTSDPFFKKVLDSQRAYAELIRPWWNATLKSFVYLTEEASKK